MKAKFLALMAGEKSLKTWTIKAMTLENKGPTSYFYKSKFVNPCHDILRPTLWLFECVKLTILKFLQENHKKGIWLHSLMQTQNSLQVRHKVCGASRTFHQKLESGGCIKARCRWRSSCMSNVVAYKVLGSLAHENLGIWTTGSDTEENFGRKCSEVKPLRVTHSD